MPMIFDDSKSAWGFTLKEHRAKWKSDLIVALIGAGVMMGLASMAHGDEAKIVVCPAHLDYCFYEKKPILDKMRGEDAIAAAKEIVRRNEERVLRQRGY